MMILLMIMIIYIYIYTHTCLYIGVKAGAEVLLPALVQQREDLTGVSHQNYIAY